MYKRLLVNELGRDFRRVTSVHVEPIPSKALLQPRDVLVRHTYAGINAADILYSAGLYKPNVSLPFPCGMEAMGEVAAVGSEVSIVQKGDLVLSSCTGAFAEYQVIPSYKLRRVQAETDAEQQSLLALELSGTTASISLEHHMPTCRKGSDALVTAAAGGTGHIAAQLLIQHGFSVIGVCGSERKEAFLKQIGCSHVINYNATDNIELFLQTSAPRGLSCVYESVGGSWLQHALTHMAYRGQLISIGRTSEYQNAQNSFKSITLSETTLLLLRRSASLHSFFLPHYSKEIPTHASRLLEMTRIGKLQVITTGNKFSGIESIPDALDYLFSGQSIGKVMVDLRS